MPTLSDPIWDGNSGLWGEWSRSRDQNRLVGEKGRVWLAAGEGAEVGTKIFQPMEAGCPAVSVSGAGVEPRVVS